MRTRPNPRILLMKLKSSMKRRKKDSRRDQSMKSRDTIRNSTKLLKTTRRRLQRLTTTTRTHSLLSRMRKIKLKCLFKINLFNCKRISKSWYNSLRAKISSLMILRRTTQICKTTLTNRMIINLKSSQKREEISAKELSSLLLKSLSVKEPSYLWKTKRKALSVRWKTRRSHSMKPRLKLWARRSH